MPDLVMDIVKQMPTIDFDWLAGAFDSHPQLLLSCLEERAEDQQKVGTHSFLNLISVFRTLNSTII
jgi:hypothetical protein